jgi:AcrR family transcriptional regulator
MTTQGRVHQKERTRTAIVAATRDLVSRGDDVTMPAVATAARVSEATAYRYFTDLASLLREALNGIWPTPAEALAPVADVQDPVERIAFATEYLLRAVQSYQGAVRAAIAASITRKDAAEVRPGRRFGLIELALEPIADSTHPAEFAQLKLDLAVVLSAEALFTLTDLCGLTPDEAIASAVHTARTITEAATTAG